MSNLYELEQAWDHLNDAHYQKAIKACQSYLAYHPQLVLEAHRIAGMAFFRLHNYKQAVDHFDVVAQVTNMSVDWFQLTIAATLAGWQTVGEDAFRKSLTNYADTNTEGTLSVPNMRMAYMQTLIESQQIDKAFDQLDELRKLYELDEITEEIYLYMQGMPSLSDVLQTALPVLNAMKEKQAITKWLDDFSQKLDDKGQELIGRIKQELN